MVATLFTETGLMPLRVRRAQLAISYLIHLLQLPHCHYTYAALQESKTLLQGGCPSWMGDLNWVIEHLPSLGMQNVHMEDMNCEQLENLMSSLQSACDRVLQNVIETSSKCALLHGHLETGEDGKRTQIIRKLRHYLTMVQVPAHQKAFASIMFSNHPLAMERLRWRE
jgi:hypothetical protein